MNSNVKLPLKIISPKSGRSILVSGEAYKKLLKEGYTEQELLKNSNNEINLIPVRKSPKITVKQDFKIGFTGIIDTDKYFIDQLDLRDLLQFYQIDKYVKNLVDSNDKLKELIKLLKKSSIYDSKTQSYRFKQNVYVPNNITRVPIILQTEIIDYTLKLLEDRKVDEAMKIVDFYEPKDKSNINYHNFYDEYFYGRLFYEIMESDLIDSPYIFEDYFSIAPNNVNWGFLEDALEIPFENWYYNDSFRLVKVLLKSSEITRKNKLYDEIVSIWNSWYDSLKEVLIEEGTVDDLKTFHDLQKIIDNHYKK